MLRLRRDLALSVKRAVATQRTATVAAAAPSTGAFGKQNDQLVFLIPSRSMSSAPKLK